jgi:hypothetical protein
MREQPAFSRDSASRQHRVVPQPLADVRLGNHTGAEIKQQARPNPPMQLRSWTPRRSGTLRGFASISVPAIGLELDDISVHVLGERRWANLPGKPMLDRDGNVLRDERGKVKYAAPLRWLTRGLALRFSERVVALVLEHNPGAFDPQAPP